MENTSVGNMAVIRVISGLLEIGMALVFIKIGRVDTALRLNALLGLIGPLVFMAVSLLGVVAIAVKLSWLKIALTVAGLILVLWGTKV